MKVSGFIIPLVTYQLYTFYPHGDGICLSYPGMDPVGKFWGGARIFSRDLTCARSALPSARVRCASAQRSSCGRGAGAQPPENFEVFAHYIPHTSSFGNREQFLDQLCDNLKICTFCLCIIQFFEKSASQGAFEPPQLKTGITNLRNWLRINVSV